MVSAVGASAHSATETPNLLLGLSMRYFMHFGLHEFGTFMALVDDIIQAFQRAKEIMFN